MDDYDRGYRSGHLSYSGDLKLDIVSSKSLNSNSSYTYQKARSPEQPPYFFPPKRKARKSSGGSGMWCLGDPEMKRKRRVASYKVYSVEGKVKASIRKGFRWIKNKCSELVHGW